MTDNLGTDAYDLVLLAQVAHHFTASQNRDLARKVARALRPGGYYVIYEAISPRSPKTGGFGPFISLFDLYFALTSQSGSWSFEEMAEWQRAAGLDPRKPIRSLIPAVGWQVGVKRVSGPS
ncbi:MAG TPA: class I SAM-dependent methyltransferase [Thermoplasmata archaeon]|nr:class I SAM-dependent methyltransferase [Thermoplasmata archaeon]